MSFKTRNKVYNFVKDSSFLTTFFAAFFIGLVLYLPMALSKYIGADAMLYISTKSQNTWMQYARYLIVIYEKIKELLNINNYHPKIFLITSIIIYAFSLALFSKIFCFKKWYFNLLLGSTIALPVFSELYLLYLFNTPIYSICFLFFTIAIYIYKDGKYNIFVTKFLFYGFCLLGMFIYQPYFQLVTASFVLFIIIETIDSTKRCRDIILSAIYKFIDLIVVLILFSIIKFIISNSTYQPNNFGIMPLLKCYGAVLILPFKSYAWINESIISKICFLIIYVFITINFIFILKDFNDKIKILFAIILAILFPIALNFIYFCCTTMAKRYLTEFIFIFIITLLLCEYNYKSFKFMFLTKLIPICLFIIIIFNSILIYKNTSILNNIYCDEKNFSLKLVSDIKNLKSDKQKICFLCNSGKSRKKYFTMQNLSSVYDKEALSSGLYIYGLACTWHDTLVPYLEYYTGEKLPLTTDEKNVIIATNNSFESAPSYPNDGYFISYDEETCIVKLN